MALNVKLGASTTGNFKVKFDSPAENLTLKNAISTGSRLDALGDVDSTASSANGSMLLYDNSTDTYVQTEILTYDKEREAFKMNGGEF